MRKRFKRTSGVESWAAIPIDWLHAVLTTPALAALGTLLFAGPARPQQVQPGQERPELPGFEEEAKEPLLRPLPEVPDFEPPLREPGTLLPPLKLPEGPGTDSLSAGRTARLERIDIRGNTALTKGELEQIAQRYLGRDLSFTDIQLLRDELTFAYVRSGYVTSGAVIPEQSLADGVLEIDMVEGVLERVEIATDGRFRESALRSRIERGAGPPVNVRELEQQLQILQEDERIRSVQAALVPGEQRGESILRVDVIERDPWWVRLGADNYVSPAIGGAQGGIEAGWTNITGWGDAIEAEYLGGGEGLHDVRAAYEIPLGPWGTTFDLHFRRTWSEVVEEPFDELDIESRTQTYGFTLRQPLKRTRAQRLTLFGSGEWRRSESYLLGEAFSFVEGPDEGEATISVARVGLDWSQRSTEQVFALRSQLSIGLDVLGATDNSGDVPDGQFLAWLLQLQLARRLPWLDAQIIAGADLQLSDEPLLGLEQFSIGGRHTVRGYRESLLVRDQGAVGRLELRVPLPMLGVSERWRPWLELAPFSDVGQSWNSKRGEQGPQTLVSVGIGARAGLADLLSFEIYWGRALKSVSTPGEYSIQDDGIHMALSGRFP